MARSSPLEYEPRHAEVARRNIERAGYADRIEVRVGAAADTLPLLAAERLQPFDFVFIDADKPNNPVYLKWAIKLGRPGTVIVLDNVVRDGEVAQCREPRPQCTRQPRRFRADRRRPAPFSDGAADGRRQGL
jgi:predicted O-methyltransferase YrrM